MQLVCSLAYLSVSRVLFKARVFILFGKGQMHMYQALYRKYRPKVFKDVIGQPHVTVTLQNELSSGRIGHAYLFIGSRGTGKTTCAKIFAKAVNCTSLIDGNPCGECALCREIDSGEVMDIVELDAASNNGVNDIREICESAAFTPAKAKFRVYIIDEVHMLSAGAFNALLKTLEEPPAHVIFILATTEVHKIPATILSRCQRFEFHKISADDIASRLKFVTEQEGAEIDRAAATLIARISDGAMRDALAILDKCLGVEKNISAETVSETVGIASSEQIFELARAILTKQPQETINIVDNFNTHSKDMLRLTHELIGTFRNMMLIKTLHNAKDLLVISEDDYATLCDLTNNVSLETIIFIVDTLQTSFEKMNRGCDAKTELEICLIKLCAPELNYSSEALANRLEALEKKVKLLVANGGIAHEKKPIKRAESQSSMEKTKVSKSEAQEQPSPKTATDATLANLQKNAQKMTSWNDVLDALKEHSHTIAMAFKGSSAYVSGDFVLIDSNNEMAFELLRKSSQRDKMREAIKNVTGRAYKLGPYAKPKTDEPAADPLETLADTARQLGINVNDI